MTKNAYDPDKDPTVIAQRKRNLVLFQLDWLVSQDPIRWYLFVTGVKEAQLPYSWITEALSNYVTNMPAARDRLKELTDQLQEDVKYCHHNEDSHGEIEGTGPSGIRWSECLACKVPGNEELAEWLNKATGLEIRGLIDDIGIYTDAWELTACGMGTTLKRRFIEAFGGKND